MDPLGGSTVKESPVTVDNVACTMLGTSRNDKVLFSMKLQFEGQYNQYDQSVSKQNMQFEIKILISCS